MGHFEANETFSVEPFVMLGIGGTWREKFVQSFSHQHELDYPQPRRRKEKRGQETENVEKS